MNLVPSVDAYRIVEPPRLVEVKDFDFSQCKRRSKFEGVRVAPPKNKLDPKTLIQLRPEVDGGPELDLYINVCVECGQLFQPGWGAQRYCWTCRAAKQFSGTNRVLGDLKKAVEGLILYCKELQDHPTAGLGDRPDEMITVSCGHYGPIRTTPRNRYAAELLAMGYPAMIVSFICKIDPSKLAQLSSARDTPFHRMRSHYQTIHIDIRQAEMTHDLESLLRMGEPTVDSKGKVKMVPLDIMSRNRVTDRILQIQEKRQANAPVIAKGMQEYLTSAEAILKSDADVEQKTLGIVARVFRHRNATPTLRDPVT